MILRNIPNTLTILRLLLVWPLVFFILNEDFTSAFVLFFLAGLTDGLDGFLARQFNWQSQFGSIADPIADKLLISLCFLSLGALGKLPAWLVILVLLRDLSIVLGILAWFWYIRRPLRFNPTRISKLNTVLQLGLVFFCLLDLAFFKLQAPIFKLMIGLTALTTLISYINYVWTGARSAYLHTPPASE